MSYTKDFPVDYRNPDWWWKLSPEEKACLPFMRNGTSPIRVHDFAEKIARFNRQFDVRDAWNFVIVRCSYSSEEQWQRYLSLLKKHVKNFHESYQTPELYATLSWTIIEDRDRLDKASVVDGMRAFQKWVYDGPGKEERLAIEHRHRLRNSNTPGGSWSPQLLGPARRYSRYRFCVVVNEEALDCLSSVPDYHTKKFQNFHYMGDLLRLEWADEEVTRYKHAVANDLPLESTSAEELEQDIDYFHTMVDDEEELLYRRTRIEHHMANYVALLPHSGWDLMGPILRDDEEEGESRFVNIFRSV